MCAGSRRAGQREIATESFDIAPAGAPGVGAPRARWHHARRARPLTEAVKLTASRSSITPPTTIAIKSSGIPPVRAAAYRQALDRPTYSRGEGLLAPEHVEIVVAPASLDRSGSSSVTGSIWLRHGRRDEPYEAFPEADWTDFPVVILAWWLDAFAALESSDATEAECRFMDGPFEFHLMTDAPTLLRVRCLGRGITPGEVVADFRTPAASVREALHRAANAVLAECDRRGWRGRDVEQLRRARAGKDGPHVAI